MKTLITALAFCLSFISLSGQENPQTYQHSLSLNFDAPFNELRRIFQPVRAGVLLMPGLEYRFRFKDRFAWRVGATYRPRQIWINGELGSSYFSQTSFSSFGISSGIQFYFWPKDYIPSFQLYAFADVGRDWYQDDFLTINDAVTPRESLSSSTIRSTSALVGLGFGYILGNRWIIRYETSYIAMLINRELIINNQAGPANPTNLKYTSHDWVPVSELSIGWRF